ncbi:MAG: integrase arm-type DNA-binding domain-containing protein, partial [Methylobacteriaceae bacterium]|nr:integrase arm-type DNA-binding domain-containing protein [Methylobacteriaceae bacterium]
MPRTLGRLTALKISRAATPGMYPDGGGLYLQVTGASARSWIYRFTLNGRPREMGLGSLAALSLSDARAKAAECRRMREDGKDPIDARRAARATDRLAAAKAMTFKDAAKAYIAAHRSAWRNAKHVEQWKNTLATYVDPVFGSLPVPAIDMALVLKALEPMWTSKPETAARVRGRIESILDWATVRGYRQGENPARWRGHLDKVLPAKTKVRKVKHHAALPYGEIPEFMAALRQRDGIAARALEFTILTVARTGDTIGATWDEVDLANRLWTIPAARMKAGREHRVALTARALEIVEEMKATRDPQVSYVFPGGRRG